MTRFARKPAIIALPVALIAILAATSVASAASLEWSNPLQLRERDNVYLSDAAYAGDNVAVVWSEYRPNAMGVRTSDDGGLSFGPMLRVARAGGQVALCGDRVYVAYAQRLSSDNIVVKLATSTAGSGNFDISTIAGGPGLQVGADVACNSGRVFVSWYESDGDDYRLQVSSALVSNMNFGSPISIATDSGDYPFGFSIAATDKMAYAVYSFEDDPQVYMKRWSIGSGPGFALNGRPTQVVATGDEVHESHSPVIGVDGSTVAVAYGKCSGIKIRVSHDGGRTWSVGRTISFTGCHWIAEGGAGASSVEVSGDTILVNWSAVGIPNYQESFYSVSEDDFRTFTRMSLGNHRSDHVGFMTTASGVSVGDAFSRRSFVKFRESTSAF